jgi:hypothetical protein
MKEKMARQVSLITYLYDMFRNENTAVLPVQALISKISYVFSIFSSSEMKLVKSKREAIGRVLELASTKPWDTVKAQILHTLESTLAPSTINMHDYEVSYTIPRCVTQALPLANETDYSHMVKNATKGKTPVLTVKMTVIQKATQVRDSMHFLCIFSHSGLDRTTRIRRTMKEELTLMNQRVRRVKVM